MTVKQEALTPFFDRAEAEYERLSISADHQVILYYCGDLNFGFANALASRLEVLLSEQVFNRQARKRFFAVFIEAIQNIRIHGCVDDVGKVYASVLVYLKDGKLFACFMNMVTSAQAKFLSRRYAEVNALSPEALKEKYLKVLKEGDISEKGGAGLGIITIVMRSRNPSEFEVIPLTDNHRIFATLLKVALD
ncbi:MAG: SiaB family protein kinase [Cryomorphaceae bacterium]